MAYADSVEYVYWVWVYISYSDTAKWSRIRYVNVFDAFSLHFGEQKYEEKKKNNAVVLHTSNHTHLA